MNLDNAGVVGLFDVLRLKALLPEGKIGRREIDKYVLTIIGDGLD